MDKLTKKERKRLKKELEFYLDNYQKVATRTKRMKRVFEAEIKELVEKLTKSK